MRQLAPPTALLRAFLPAMVGNLLEMVSTASRKNGVLGASLIYLSFALHGLPSQGNRSEE